MIKFFYTILYLSFVSFSFSQDNGLLLKEAKNFEMQFKEPEALDKYKEVITNDPNNYFAIQKVVELSCSIGARKKK